MSGSRSGAGGGGGSTCIPGSTRIARALEQGVPSGDAAGGRLHPTAGGKGGGEGKRTGKLRSVVVCRPGSRGLATCPLGGVRRC